MESFDQELQSQLADIKRHAHDTAKLHSNVALQGLRPKQDESAGKDKPSISDKLMAIQDMYDLQERTNIGFIVLGDLANTIHDKIEYYDGDVVQVGFHISNLVPEIKSLFAGWDFKPTKYGYKYYFTPPTKWNVKVPIEIHTYKIRYPFFENPDIGFFGVDEYRIPNPFATYWQYRNEIP